VELPRWINLPADRPLETMGPVTSALSLMCVAGAQDLAVKKAVLKGTSKGIIVKLSADVWRKYESAVALLQTLPDNAYNSTINTTLKNFLNSSMNLQKANTFKFAGQTAMEGGKCGLAVASLSVSTKALKSISGALPLWKGMIAEQTADVEHYARVYLKENDLIAFDKVPDEASLAVPEPKSLMAAQAYAPPTPIAREIK